jgi:hypothetical protein
MGPCPGVIDEDPGVDIHREEQRILCTTWHWILNGSRGRVKKSGKKSYSTVAAERKHDPRLLGLM